MRDHGPRRWEFVEAAAAERVLQGGLGVNVDCARGCVGYAPDALTDSEITHLLAAGSDVRLVLTRPRLLAIDPDLAPLPPIIALPLDAWTEPARVRAYANPLLDMAGLAEHLPPPLPADAAETAAVQLAKNAALLPAVLAVSTAVPGLPVRASITAAAVSGQRMAAARTLSAVGEAVIPLEGIGPTRLIAFRSRLGGHEHHAVLVGEPEAADAPLCRLHSECFTGDIFGSRRCDCGQQLRGALLRMRDEGAGVLLYLAQEGRGIGLVNKLHAYRLQDTGIDTVDANSHLGFEPDERDFLAAATMLGCLGVTKARLLTNNPVKIAALRNHGITVTERVPHAFMANSHNRSYLETKARRAGHLLSGSEPSQDGCACTGMV